MQKWLIMGGVFLCLILTGAVAAKRMAAWLPGYLRDRAVSTLREDFASDVQFANLEISVYPQIVIRGENLVLRLQGRKDVPPLISIRKFSTEIAFWELLSRTRHVRKITLEGLRVTMPPVEARRLETSRPARGKKGSRPFRVLVDEIVADGAELDMMVQDPIKPPHVFYIRHLRLQHAGLGQAMTYQATLTNPVPVGEIESRGQFGPGRGTSRASRRLPALIPSRMPIFPRSEVSAASFPQRANSSVCWIESMFRERRPRRTSAWGSAATPSPSKRSSTPLWTAPPEIPCLILSTRSY